MLKQIQGSQGVAQAIALCRPEVICAYPISPQTHIVEALGALTGSGKLEDCEFINVESEVRRNECGHRFLPLQVHVLTPLLRLRDCCLWQKLCTTHPVWDFQS